MSPDTHNPIPPDADAGWKQQYGPLAMKVLAGFIGVILAIVAARLGIPAPVVTVTNTVPAPEVQPAPAPAPVVMQSGDPQVAQGLFDGRLRKRIAAVFLRARAVERAVADGLPVAGGGTRKVTREEAWKLAERVDNDTLFEAAVVHGAPVGEGRIEAFLNWLWENREAIIRFVLMLMSLFADDAPPMP